MKQEMQLKSISLIILSLLFLTSLASVGVEAAVVWSDNFDDGNYDGWTVHSGSFSVTDGKVVATGADNLYTPIFGNTTDNFMTYPSTVVMGNWSFEVSLDDNRWTTVAFMSHGAGPFTIENENIFPVMAVEFALSDLSLVKYPWGLVSAQRVVADSTDLDSSAFGLCRVSVLRNSTNDFYVYLNGSLVIETSLIVPDDTYSYFGFLGDTGSSIDNIIVNDIDTTTTTTTDDTTTTTTTEDTTPTDGAALPLEWIAIGGGGIAVVVIVLIIFLKRK